MTFREAEAFLLSRRSKGMKLGLENMSRAMKRLRHPETAFPAVAVAGSKGKGSVCAFLESILAAAGCGVGLYTSPHLVTVRERIRIKGTELTPRSFARLLSQVRRDLGSRAGPLTYFEWLTVMAIACFSERKVSPGIFEVGLGGRLDATNIVPAGLAVITEIEKEHTGCLGSTLGGIATEKAGIVKEGATVLAGVSSPAARRAVARAAAERGARLRWLDREATWEVTSHTRRGLGMNLSTAESEYGGLRLGIIGRHQAHNAALAVLAVEELRRRGFTIGRRHLREGLARARWPGRNEYHPGRPALFLDGAHTPLSVKALVRTLDELFPRRPRVLLFGALRDKNIPALAVPLLAGTKEAVLVRPPEERGADPEETVRLLPKRWRRRCRPAVDVSSAIDTSRRLAGRSGVVVVAGSLFLVGAVLGELRRRAGRGRGAGRDKLLE